MLQMPILVQTLFHYNVALNTHSSDSLLQAHFASRLQAGLGAHPLPPLLPPRSALPPTVARPYAQGSSTPAPGEDQGGVSRDSWVSDKTPNVPPQICNPEAVTLRDARDTRRPGLGREITPLVTSQ